MERKCPKCASDQVVELVPSAAAIVPEVQEKIAEGKAETACCGRAVTAGQVFRCKNCNFEWDFYYEVAQEDKKNA